MEFGDMQWEAEIVATHYRLTRERSPASGECSLEEYTGWARAYHAFDTALMSAHQSVWFSRFHQQLTDHIRRQGRALLIFMSKAEQRDFHTATLNAPNLRALYAINIYTEMKDAVLNRKLDEVTSIFNNYTNLFITAYRDIKNSD
ncbi:hypothetical protein [Pseudochrobactrum asaccharolyticum]|uniref:hypothetical protein n=1 Tax=Pseudochrobactrum asaccharolyticum TaxID=354351 RepID=UPI0040434501